MNDRVIVICYGKSKQWIRSEAISFFAEGVLSCDGSERERYSKVLTALLFGCQICTDQ